MGEYSHSAFPHFVELISLLIPYSIFFLHTQGHMHILDCPIVGMLPSGDYRQTSNISCTLVGNTIVDHSDVVGASPVGAAPTTSSFST